MNFYLVTYSVKFGQRDKHTKPETEEFNAESIEALWERMQAETGEPWAIRIYKIWCDNKPVKDFAAELIRPRTENQKPG